MRKIGIIGGTFDPPHYGHLLIANEVYHALNLEEVWFLPNQIPPHKQGRNITSVESRLQMLELATEEEEHFSICLEELSRKGPSYTYDTMLQLTKKHPDVQFHFIIGGDMVEYLPKWYNIEALLDLVTFVGVARPGYTLHTPYPITTVEIPEFAVSSSLLRERYKEKKTCKYLLPEKYRYISRGMGCMNREEALHIVKQQMHEKRYIHTIGVMETAIELAKLYGVDEKRLKLQLYSMIMRSVERFQRWKRSLKVKVCRKIYFVITKSYGMHLLGHT